MENPNEPTKDLSRADPGDEKPFPLTTEWFELQRQEAAENARKRKAEREQERANKGKARSRESKFLQRWRFRQPPPRDPFDVPNPQPGQRDPEGPSTTLRPDDPINEILNPRLDEA